MAVAAQTEEEVLGVDRWIKTESKRETEQIQSSQLTESLPVTYTVWSKAGSLQERANRIEQLPCSPPSAPPVARFSTLSD